MLAAIWFPDLTVSKWGLGAVIVGMSLRVRPDREYFTSAFFASWRSKTEWIAAAKLTLTMTAILIGLSLCFGTWSGDLGAVFGDKSLRHWMMVKLPTVGLQQWLLLILLLPLLLTVCRKRTQATIAGASIFSLVHLPNPLLMLLTWVVSIFWIRNFQRGNQILPIIASHFFLAVVAAGLCGEYSFNMRVGPKCLALYPTPIEENSSREGSRYYHWPQCILGCVKQMTQETDYVTLQGWSIDTIHRDAPSKFYLENKGKLTPIAQAKTSEIAPEQFDDAAQSGFCNGKCFAFELRFPVADLEPGNEAKIWAANANGWLAPLVAEGRIAPSALVPVGYTLVQFPQKIDGRITKVVQRNQTLSVRGWVAEQDGNPACEQVLVVNKMVDQERQFATYDCEFATPVPNFNAGRIFQVKCAEPQESNANDFAFFAVDQRQRLHRLAMTPAATVEISKLQSTGHF